MSLLLCVERLWLTEQTTIGRLYLDGVLECYTLEDRMRPRGEKVAGTTCIPEGVYRVKLVYWPKYSRLMPMLLDVPMFTGIFIHPGNIPEHTEGCILVGRTRSVDRIGESRVAFESLMQKLTSASANPVLITIAKAPEMLEGIL